MSVISFARGVPSPDILPVDLFGEAAKAIVEHDGRTVLNYGPPGGYAPLRELIAERHGVDPANIVITTGSLQAFGFVARHLFVDGGRVLIEAPSYDRTMKIFRALGAKIEAVELADDGLDVSVLADMLSTAGAPKLLYTIPTFQNPTGRTLSLENRRRLATLIVESDLMVYEDDPYGLVRFEGESLPSLHELCERRTIFSSSFSKTIAPGIRVGYVVLPEHLVKPIEALAADTYVSPSIFVQGALYEFLKAGHFDANLARTCRELKARRDMMLKALERDFPEGSSWNHPAGGYFLWIDLPEGVKCDQLLTQATERGITFLKGSDFFVDAGGEESLRLAFSYPSVEDIDEGVGRLGELVRAAAAARA